MIAVFILSMFVFFIALLSMIFNLIDGEESIATLFGLFAVAALLAAALSGTSISNDHNQAYQARCNAVGGHVVDINDDTSLCLNKDKTINFEVGSH